MKKIIVLSCILLSLASCTKATNPATVENTGSLTSTSVVVGTGTTGSGYEDKEVEQTMKEIDGIFNDLSGTGGKK